MSDNSKIEWCDASWNPATGCTKVSPACAHCYIERTPPFRIAGRTFVNGHIPVILHPERLDQPLRWMRPRMVFVNSLSDLFHEDIPDSFIDQVFMVMESARQHTFQVLTKRPARMRDFLLERLRIRTGSPAPNIWLGVSVENQHFADERIPLLLETPAVVRFISAEPLLGPLDLYEYLPCESFISNLHQLNWVIVGGESGAVRRRTDPAWVRDVQRQCARYHVPFFFKQWGGVTAKSGGRALDGRTYSEMPCA